VGLFEDNVPRHDEFNFSSARRRTGQGQFGADARSALIHADYSEMRFRSLGLAGWVHAMTVIANANGQILSVPQLDAQMFASRMNAGVPNRFVGDPVDFIANDGMHLSARPLHDEIALDGLLKPAFDQRPLQRFGKIVAF
jgi:hypothetical protein